MPTPIDINQFSKLSEIHPILDVRTPAEFAQGHIPGAINFPIFTNEERVIIGTLYKKEGKQPAVLKGLELVGPKLHKFIEQANKINKATIGKEIFKMRITQISQLQRMKLPVSCAIMHKGL